jgi:prevent-host-death family protein
LKLVLVSITSEPIGKGAAERAAKGIDKLNENGYVPDMTATLRESQADLQRLVELASRGEDVVITVDGKPKAKLTSAGASFSTKSPDMASWLKNLEELRQRYHTGKMGPTVEQILEEDRAERL